jgi:hypothetical protein
MKKALPLIFVLVGLAFLVTAIVFWIDTRTSNMPPSFGQSLRDWLTLIVGLGASIKGWIDLLKTEKPIPPTIQIEIKGGNAQISLGSNSQNTQNLTSGDELYRKFSEKPLSQYIRVQEFEALVNERTRNFVGREYIFSALDQFLNETEFQCGYVIISGEPGIGKTSLLAQLVKNKGYLHHFNVLTQNIRSSRDFLSNVCAQVIVRYELEYSSLPENKTKDSGFLVELLNEAAKNVQNHPIVVLVDALDEADDLEIAPGGNSLNLPRDLPNGVYFVVTTRRDQTYRLEVAHQKHLYLRDDDPRNLDDVRHYIKNYLDTHREKLSERLTEWNVDENQFSQILTQKSEGNFMYLVKVLDDIVKGRLTIANVNDIHNLPEGLRNYYHAHWEIMERTGKEQFGDIYKKVICHIAAIDTPISVRKLAEYTGLELSEVSSAIRQWESFLNIFTSPKGETLYSIYHCSFQDFLKEDIGLIESHRHLANRLRNKVIKR